MTSEARELRERVEELEREIVLLRQSRSFQGVRRRSRVKVWGLPLYDIATGPDPERGEVRGHARGIFALGDVATGVVAVGGIARGVFAIGGVAVGLVALGGCAIGGLAIGGGALGLVALGGGAVGLVAVGGGAIGYFACGGQAFGQHILSPLAQDPEAVRFFQSWTPGVTGALNQAKPN